MREKIDSGCSIVGGNCTYTAETHHIIAAKKKRLANLVQILPAVVAALLAAGSVIVKDGDLLQKWPELPQWLVWASALSAGVAAVSNYINPLSDYESHLSAAKGFTILKQDARALRDIFSAGLSDEVYMLKLQCLHERYADLVRTAPPTDKSSFEEAQRRIKAGVHDPD